MRIAESLYLQETRDPGGFDLLPAVTGDRSLELRLVADLIARGWTREHIMAVGRLSRATFYRRLAELRRHNPRITCPTLRGREESGPGHRD